MEGLRGRGGEGERELQSGGGAQGVGVGEPRRRGERWTEREWVAEPGKGRDCGHVRSLIALLLLKFKIDTRTDFIRVEIY